MSLKFGKMISDIAFYVFCTLSWGPTYVGNQPTHQQTRSRRSAYAPADGSEGIVK